MDTVWVSASFPSNLIESAQGSNAITSAGWILIVIAVIAMLVLAWWVIRSNRKELPPSIPPDYSQPVHPASAPVVEPIVRAAEIPVPAAAPDDLVIIEGIGPKINSVLHDAGILTFSQLAALQPDQIKAILDQGGIRLADPRSWPEQARLAANGDMNGLKALQDRLTAGRS